MFHPMRYWWRRGPFTPLFIAFLKSNIKGASKFTIMAYVGTYCNSVMNSLNFRRDGEYMDLCIGQLLYRRLVFSDSRPILHGLLQYSHHGRFRLRDLRSSLQRRPPLPLQNGLVHARTCRELHVDTNVRHLLRWSKYAHLMGIDMLSPLHRHAVGCNCKGNTLTTVN
jgi:hypothetical protein